MGINFPASPTLNQTYTYGIASWKWDGSAWRRIPDPGAPGPGGDPGTPVSYTHLTLPTKA